MGDFLTHTLQAIMDGKSKSNWIFKDDYDLTESISYEFVKEESMCWFFSLLEILLFMNVAISRYE